MIAEWYVLGRRYSANCSKGNLDSIRYSCMPYPGLCVYWGPWSVYVNIKVKSWSA